MADNQEAQDQPTSDPSLPTDENGQNEEFIAHLRRKKRICKSQLTKSKLLLTSLLCSREKPVDAIRAAVDNILRHSEEVIDILNNLCEQRSEFEDELETIQSDSGVAELLSKATTWLCNLSDDQNPVISNQIVDQQRNLVQTHIQGTEQENGVVESHTTNGASVFSDNQEQEVQPMVQQNGSSSNTPSTQISNFSQKDRDLYRQLSKVSINKFDGNKREYQVFKDAFTECIDKTSCSKAYKMLQLRQHLTGEALKTVEGFPVSDIGYDAALKRLEDKFGGERRAILIHLDNVRLMNPVNINDIKRVEEFVDNLELCILSLKDNGRTEEFNENSMFFSVARSKLSANILMQYKRWADHRLKEQSLLTLFEYLQQEVLYRIESQEEADGLLASKTVTTSAPRSQNNWSQYRHRFNKRKTFATNIDSPKPCAVCEQSHSIGINNCTYFRSLTVSERWQAAKDKKLCFRCLSTNHRGSKCNSVQQCAIEGCRRTHHYLLHTGRGNVQYIDNSDVSVPRPTFSDKHPSAEALRQEEGPLQRPRPLYAVNDEQTWIMQTHTQIRKLTALVMRVVPVVLRNYNRTIQCNALMDDCSTDSYINENIADELGLQGEITDLDVCVLGGKSSSLNAIFVSLEVCSLDYKTCIPFTAFTVKNVTGDLRTIDWNDQARFWPHLRDIPFPQIADTRVDLLLGLNVSGVHRAIANSRSTR